MLTSTISGAAFTAGRPTGRGLRGVVGPALKHPVIAVPRIAAPHPMAVRLGPGRIHARCGLVVMGVVVIAHPFPGVAHRVIQAIGGLALA